MMNDVFKNDVLTIGYDDQKSLMTLTWKGLTVLSLFKECIDHYSVCINKYKPARLLIDVREHKGTSPEGQAYAAEATHNFAKNNGIQLKQALVLSHDIFSVVSVKGYDSKLNTKEAPVITESFDSKDKALHWLLPS
jgi:hypothetical protein